MKVKFDYYWTCKRNEVTFNPLFIWFINSKGMRFLTIQILGLVITFDWTE